LGGGGGWVLGVVGAGVVGEHVPSKQANFQQKNTNRKKNKNKHKQHQLSQKQRFSFPQRPVVKLVKKKNLSLTPKVISHHIYLLKRSSLTKQQRTNNTYTVFLLLFQRAANSFYTWVREISCFHHRYNCRQQQQARATFPAAFPLQIRPDLELLAQAIPSC